MAQLPHPAAVHVAAVNEEEEAWLEALDIDDSELRFSPPSSSCSLRPSTAAAPHTHKPSRGPPHGQCIPGPASAVQEAVRLRDSGASPVFRSADAQADDAVFLRHPWLCALQFLGKDRAWEQPGIKSIKADWELDRAPLVVGVVTSCKPNMLGDLSVTLKDPSDTIGATVHRKVLSEGNDGQDISVGCVIVLRKVTVFRPSHTACYLNITKARIVKVVQKDCDPPFKLEISSGTTESQSPVATWKETQFVAHLGDKHLGTSEGKASIFRKMFPGGQGGLPMFGRDEARDSANIMTRLLPSSKEMTVDEVSCNQHRRLDSRIGTSAHKLSSSTDVHSQQSFHMPNATCSQPIPDGCSLIPAYRSGTQASDNINLRLPFSDELMLPSSKKAKNDAVLRDCYGATMTMDTKGKHGSENNMDIDLPDIAAFHGGHSTMLAGTAQTTKKASATDAAANNGRPFHSQQNRTVFVACPTGWTDEEISELSLDY